jgi:hypothetical protein
MEAKYKTVSKRQTAVIIAAIFVAPVLLLGVTQLADKPQPSLEGRGTAIVKCREAITRQANHPSTVDFDTFGTSAEQVADGWRVLTTFTAKNSYGLELGMKGICIVPDSGDVFAVATER